MRPRLHFLAKPHRADDGRYSYPWGVHVCQLDKDCRQYSSKEFPLPWRLNISTPHYWVGIALRPRDRFASIDPVAWRERKEKIELPLRWVDVRRHPA